MICVGYDHDTIDLYSRTSGTTTTDADPELDKVLCLTPSWLKY